MSNWYAVRLKPMAARRETHSQEVLCSLLRYEADTGHLYWLPRDVSLFTGGKIPAERACKIWNSRFAGKRAFTADNGKGYKYGDICGLRAYAHRAIWKMVYGVDPDFIDHINGAKGDNRLLNLRSVSNSENQMNSPKKSNNKSGVIGVHWSQAAGKWHAQITVDQKVKYLGVFEAFEDAVAARKDAEKQFGFHPNHGRSRYSNRGEA